MFLLSFMTLDYPLILEIYLKFFLKYVMVSSKKSRIFKFFWYIKRVKHSKGGRVWTQPTTLLPYCHVRSCLIIWNTYLWQRNSRILLRMSLLLKLRSKILNMSVLKGTLFSESDCSWRTCIACDRVNGISIMWHILFLENF